MNKIHPTAIIQQGAELGDNIDIGPYCIVGSQVILGDDCILRSHVVIEGKTVIGKQNVFFQFGTIGSDPQDLKYHQENSLLTIGDHNTFRESVSIHKGTKTGRGETTVGNHNLFMGSVHIGHDCQIGDYNIFPNHATLAGHVIIDDHVNTGGLTGITQFIRIGSYSFLGAGTIIDKHIAPYTIGHGNRVQIKGVNIIGLKRNNFSKESISNILDVHKMFFRSEMSGEDALRAIKEQYGHLDEIQVFLDFFHSVDGGVRR